ncbi:homeodomain-interacting protein kinase 2-like [Antennarius striatus]|uniref:homeodomain-interacting protein kinase 2-like n=1 Tax=Antennarius striatus TaxID=241820 RepID=UPI0035B09F79
MKAIHNLLNPDTINVIKMLDQFEYMEMHCLVFEMLDKSLKHWIRNEKKSLPLKSIRVIAQQLVGALDGLISLGIIHCDLKPDNVMFVNTEEKPLRVKIIDFGSARHTTNTIIGMECQALIYRAPEVFLGLPITTAIDMWGLGCILAFLYLGDHFFKAYSKYEMMKSIVILVGKPYENLLDAGIYTKEYFIEEEGACGPVWRLKSQEEYGKIWPLAEPVTALSSLMDLLTVHDSAETEKRQFFDLLQKMLNPNVYGRIFPCEVLWHPFF